MRALNGGGYEFAGDMTGRVAAAGLYGAALAYVRRICGGKGCAGRGWRGAISRAGSLTRCGV